MNETEKKNIVAIIPARAGSKRIPKKNIIDFDGKPLIQHTIDIAQQSKYINKIIISTDDPDVREVVKGQDITIVDRPPKLATDTSTMPNVIVDLAETLEKQGEKADILVLLQPTSPLRNVTDVDNTIEAITKRGADSAQTISEVSEHPSFMVTMDKEHNLTPLNEKEHLKRSQDHQQVYIKNGSVYACTHEVIKTMRTIYGKKHHGVITPKNRSIDIDNPEDIDLALHYLKKSD